MASERDQTFLIDGDRPAVLKISNAAEDPVAARPRGARRPARGPDRPGAAGCASVAGPGTPHASRTTRPPTGRTIAPRRRHAPRPNVRPAAGSGVGARREPERRRDSRLGDDGRARGAGPARLLAPVGGAGDALGRPARAAAAADARRRARPRGPGAGRGGTRPIRARRHPCLAEPPRPGRSHGPVRLERPRRRRRPGDRDHRLRRRQLVGAGRRSGGGPRNGRRRPRGATSSSAPPAWCSTATRRSRRSSPGSARSSASSSPRGCAPPSSFPPRAPRCTTIRSAHARPPRAGRTVLRLLESVGWDEVRAAPRRPRAGEGLVGAGAGGTPRAGHRPRDDRPQLPRAAPPRAWRGRLADRCRRPPLPRCLQQRAGRRATGTRGSSRRSSARLGASTRTCATCTRRRSRWPSG